MPFNINWNYCLIAVLLVSVYPSILNVGKQLPLNSILKAIPTPTPEPTPAPKEFVLDGNSHNNVTQQSLTSAEIPKEVVLNAADGSQIRTSFDAYGNKTEVRVFFNDPKLKQIMMRTSADGQTQVYVYGQNGEVETLPGTMVERVLTGSSNEIATSAGIFKTRQEQQVKTISTLYTPASAVAQTTTTQSVEIPDSSALAKNVQEETKPEVESAKPSALTTATPDLNLSTQKPIVDSDRKP